MAASLARDSKGVLKAPFPYFGGKSKAAPLVWSRFGTPTSYVEPFAGTAAMLLAAPQPAKIETINDFDGFVANFWRAVSWAPDEVAHHADWPVNEADLEARHAWLVQRASRLRWSLEDPDFFDAKIAGWWVWGACACIGSGWCSGKGPHITDGAHIYDRRRLPHLGNAGQGITRQLPHLGNAGQVNSGRGINRQLPHLGDAGRGDAIRGWMGALCDRLRDVRVTCGDWERVLSPSVTGTARSGYASVIGAVFLDPPYTAGNMDYAAGGAGGALADDVRAWCIEHGDHPRLRIALCGHDGEHDALEQAGWSKATWKAASGMARTEDAIARRKSETVWFSPHCLPVEEGALEVTR